MQVLLVEDEPNMAAAVARGLTAEGFSVDVAGDGLEGLWRAREGSYGAIVLDILLPGMNGYQVCRTLREERNWTPILMLTAKSGEWDEVEALDTGADDYLTKPFSFDVLVARLRSLVRRSGAEVAMAYGAGDLVIDPARKECRRGAVPIDLTWREFSLLEALMRRPGTVLSKRDLIRQVWGLDFDGDPNVVEVYIGYLRRKVDRPFGRAGIETVRGFGYRFRQDGG